MSAIAKNTTQQFFVGQGELLIGAEVADYSSIDLSALEFTSLGDIKLDSTEWTGDDVTTNNIQNEQGENVASYSVAGTYAIDAVVLNSDQAKLASLMKAVNIPVPAASDWFTVAGGKVTGLGTELPVIERPFALSNDVLNQTIIFPKAKIVTAFTIEDSVVSLKINATAQKVDTDDLKTVMLLEGALIYA